MSWPHVHFLLCSYCNYLCLSCLYWCQKVAVNLKFGGVLYERCFILCFIFILQPSLRWSLSLRRAHHDLLRRSKILQRKENLWKHYSKYFSIVNTVRNHSWNVSLLFNLARWMLRINQFPVCTVVQHFYGSFILYLVFQLGTLLVLCVNGEQCNVQQTWQSLTKQHFYWME